MRYKKNPQCKATYLHYMKILSFIFRELFHQLDYHHCGTISREDFDTLCDVVEIQTPLPCSSKHFDVVDNSILKSTYRRSGLEWLSSYRQRPNSPIAPLRFDKLGDIKYNKNQPKNIDTGLVGCVGCGGSGGVLCQKHQPKVIF